MRKLAIHLALSVLTGACSDQPTEASLRDEFDRNRAGFDQLAEMAARDSVYRRIATDFVHPQYELPQSEWPNDPSEEKWDQYRQAFERLNLEGGVTVYDEESIVLERWGEGMVTSGSSIGFWRVDSLPENAITLSPDAEFDCDRAQEGWCAVVKHLADDWYLVLERH